MSNYNFSDSEIKETVRKLFEILEDSDIGEWPYLEFCANRCKLSTRKRGILIEKTDSPEESFLACLNRAKRLSEAEREREAKAGYVIYFPGEKVYWKRGASLWSLLPRDKDEIVDQKKFFGKSFMRDRPYYRCFDIDKENANKYLSVRGVQAVVGKMLKQVPNLSVKIVSV